jgi:hypothetical protein
VTGGVILGTEAEVADQVTQLAEVSATDLLVYPFAIEGIPGTMERTYECLANVAKTLTAMPS